MRKTNWVEFLIVAAVLSLATGPVASAKCNKAMAKQMRASVKACRTTARTTIRNCPKGRGNAQAGKACRTAATTQRKSCVDSALSLCN